MAKGGNHGHAGASALAAAPSADVVGTDGNDALVSQQGQVSADGGAGNDLLYGFLVGSGGDGDDTFWFGRQQSEGDPQVTFDGGAGIDRVIADMPQETQIVHVDAAGEISFTPAPIKVVNVEQIWVNAPTGDVVTSLLANGNTLIDVAVLDNHFYFEAEGSVPEVVFQSYDGMGAYW